MKLRVGLIGLGNNWETRHRPALRSLSDRFEVRAVCDQIALRAEQAAKPAAVPALYATQAEAEQAARKHFHCEGAHRMGNQWMPCSQHGEQQHHH